MIFTWHCYVCLRPASEYACSVMLPTVTGLISASECDLLSIDGCTNAVYAYMCTEPIQLHCMASGI